jgi:hypothetical protein
VLKGALESEAKKEGIRIQVEYFDKLDSGDLAADQPYLGLMEELDEVDGSHCGFPCGSFRMVKEGGSPPVRPRQGTTSRRNRPKLTRGPS